MNSTYDVFPFIEQQDRSMHLQSENYRNRDFNVWLSIAVEGVEILNYVNKWYNKHIDALLFSFAQQSVKHCELKKDANLQTLKQRVKANKNNRNTSINFHATNSNTRNNKK